MRLKRILFTALSIAPLFVGGCFPTSGSDMTKEEVYALQHPPMHPSAGAMSGMSHMGELMQKQKDQNAAMGVDSRGIPLAKSIEYGAPGTVASTLKKP